MARVVVRHGSGRYPVLIEAGAIGRLGPLLRRLAPGRRPVVITDRTVARLIRLPARWTTLVVPAGERSKSRATWAALTDRLLAERFGRDSVIVAVGGGMIGDLAGFVAATYLRGVPAVLVPTTLLAMVDASVGGKTAVNTTWGKNLVGAFHPPVAVVVDPETLATLPAAHVRAGLIEATKHGLVADRDYLRWIAAHRSALLARDPAAMTRLVARSVAIKAAIVQRDEREAGPRMVLNAGHTIGHALEQATGYRLSHGDAVGYGLVAETALAERLGLAPRPGAAALAEWFLSIGLPARWPRAPLDRVLPALARDKKVARGQPRFALLRGGAPLAERRSGWAVAAPAASVRQALEIARRTLAEAAIHRLSTSPSRLTGRGATS